MAHHIELTSFAGHDGFYRSILDCFIHAPLACVMVTGPSLSGRTTLINNVCRDMAVQHGAIVKKWSSDQPLTMLQPSHTSIAAYFAKAHLTLICIDDVDIAIAASRGLQQFLCDCIRTAKKNNVASPLKTAFLLTAHAESTGKSFKTFTAAVVDRSLSVTSPTEDELCAWLVKDLSVPETHVDVVREHVQRHGQNAARIASSQDALRDLVAWINMRVDKLGEADTLAVRFDSGISLSGGHDCDAPPENGVRMPSAAELQHAQVVALMLLSHAAVAEQTGLGGADISRTMAFDIFLHTTSGEERQAVAEALEHIAC